MTFTLPTLSGAVLVYLLVFARTGAMVMLLPPLANASVPARIRLMLALAIAVALAPTVASSYPQTAPHNIAALGVMIAQEVTVGIMIGTLARVIMTAWRLPALSSPARPACPMPKPSILRATASRAP